jgi:hypothetical protein
MVGESESGYRITALKTCAFTNSDRALFEGMLVLPSCGSDEVWMVKPSGVFALTIPHPSHS